jgi:serine/threonine-protein kinase
MPATSTDHETDDGRWAETLDLTPIVPPPSSIWERANQIIQNSWERKAEAARAALVVRAGDGDLSAETRSLLRTRLRAATWLLLIGSAAFTARNLILEIDGKGMAPHLAVIAVQVSVIALLSSGRYLSTLRLRVAEAVVFGSAIGEFLVTYSLSTTRLIEEGSALLARVESWPGPVPDELLRDLMMASGQLASQTKGMVIFGVLMMAIYGLLIPNRWRRTAGFVALILASLEIAQGVAIWRARCSIDFVEHVADLEQISSNFLTLGLGAVVAVYGSRLIHRLRLEAFNARRMGQYVLGERLGGGGMGEVYLAEHQLLKRPCAVKLIRPDRAGDPAALARFEREVQSTARLTHSNTIDIYDYGRTEDGTFYYVMEYLRGLAFDELVEKHGPLPPGRVVHLLLQACGALGEAHSRGLLHRDLKPANLFAATRGGRWDVVKVLDFGLVKPIGWKAEILGPDLTRPGAVTGSPLYMAPEQARGAVDLDERCDLHALGAVGCFLLTGEAPFRGETAVQVLASVMRDAPRRPSSVVEGVPAVLEAILLKSLAKDPSERYPSAAAMAADLLACACRSEWTDAMAAAWWAAEEPGVGAD